MDSFSVYQLIDQSHGCVFTLLMCQLRLTTQTVQLSSHLLLSKWLFAVRERKRQPTGESSESSVGGESDAREKQTREEWSGGDAGEME